MGTWGQILFPKPWKEFRLWYDKNKAKGIRPFLEGMVLIYFLKKKCFLFFTVIQFSVLNLLMTFMYEQFTSFQILFLKFCAGDYRMVQENGGKDLDSLVH